MNVREAMETISGYIDMLYDMGILANCEIIKLEDAERAIYEFLDAMEV